MSAENINYGDLAEQHRVDWEQTKQISDLERYGVYSARYLSDDPTRHWYYGENQQYGTAAMMIFAFADKEVGHLLISTLFEHLDDCNMCVHGFNECEAKFVEMMLGSTGLNDNEFVQEFQKTLFQVVTAHWAERTDMLMDSLKTSPTNTSTLNQLAVCFHTFAVNYKYFGELKREKFEPYTLQLIQILAEKGYRWLPGYLLLLFQWEIPSVSAAIVELITQNKVSEPSQQDMVSFYYVLDALNKAHPVKEQFSSTYWNQAWKSIATYFSGLQASPNAKKMALTATVYLDLTVIIEQSALPAIKQLLLKQGDFEKLVRHYFRTFEDSSQPDLQNSTPEFFEIVKALRPDNYLTVILDLVKKSDSMRASALALHISSLLEVDEATKLLLQNPKAIIGALLSFKVSDSSILETAIKHALKQGSYQVLSLLEAQVTDLRVTAELFPNMPLLLRCIRNLVFLPVFLGSNDEASNSQQYEKFDIVIRSILSRLASCDPSYLTSFASETGTLSTLWLYESSAEPQTAKTAQEILSRIDSSKINPHMAINEACDMMAFIKDVKAYSLVTQHSMKAIKDIMGVVCAVGNRNTSTLFWDRCWDYIGFVWQAGTPPLRTSVEQAKQCLQLGIECADRLIRLATSFMVNSDPHAIGQRLNNLAAALVPGGHLLRLKRKTGILKPAYEVICAILEVLNSHNFAIPPETLAILKAHSTAKHGNELEESEVKVLEYLVGVDRRASAAKAPTAPAPAPAPAHVSTHAASSTVPPKTSIKSFFQTVPRESAIANTLKQAPPPPPPPPKPKEGSRLALIREELDSKRRTAPIAPPKKIPENVVIHPARPSGFNKKEKPPSASSATPVPRPTLRPMPPENEDKSSSGEESDSVDGLIPLHKRKRNIDSELFSNITFQKRLRPPKLDEIAQEAARMKARMMANADELHKSILGWEFYAYGNYPPELVNHRIKVPNTFASAEEYTKIMRPLLLMEVWQHIQQYREARRENGDARFLLNICKRTNVDDFIDFNVMMSLESYNEMHLSENDLILLTIQRSSGLDNKKEIDKTRPHCYAKVREGSVTVHHKQKQVDLTLRTYKAEEFTKAVNQKLPISGEKILSLLTAEREYRALEGFEHCELRKQVLNAEPAARVAPNQAVVSQFITQMELNQSQAQAAYQALNSTGFNLIQGPPGTGKTKTILSIIGAFFSNPSNKRILVCAPSNAAVDELLARIKAGTKNLQGNMMNLKAVRLGRTDTVHPSVVDLCLDRQIESVVVKKANAVDNTIRDDIQALNKRKQALHLQVDETSPNDLSEDQRRAIGEELSTIRKELFEKNKLLAAQREQLDLSRRERELEYRRVQTEILSQAQVVCCTLSGSASSILSSLEIAFKTVIIDEAAQSVELSALIPFRYGCNQCIMVGDPHQLPPTVLNKAAADLDYEQSLFTRIFKQHQDKVSMLDQQFRMHPDIAVFPSKQFYDGLLSTGPGMGEKTKRIWHENPIFRPYYFYNVKDGAHKKSSKSLVNNTEIEAAYRLISELLQRYPEVDFTNKIGIVTPYKQQAQSFRRYFESKLGSSIFDLITISTIDAFQGQEKDIIIFSTVRASPDSSTIGFVGDVRRMNVAITRARASLWILGSASTLVVNSEWEKLITDAQSRKLFATAHLYEFCSNLVRCQEAAARLPPPDSRYFDYSKRNRRRRGGGRPRDNSRSSKSFRNHHDSRDNRNYYTSDTRDESTRYVGRDSHNNSSPRSLDSERELTPLPPPPTLPPSALAGSSPPLPSGHTTPPVAGGPYRNHAKSSVFNTKASRKS